MAKKTSRIIERKLRGKTFGQCEDDGLIIIDPRQDSEEYLDTLVHEMLHRHFPDLSESRTIKVANRISNAIWRKNYRRIMQ